MTEREIPEALGFLFGGMTDAAIPVSAPPALSEPENGLAAATAPVYASRREARAAGGLSVDASPAPPNLGATQAIPTADVATELATAVAPYVVPQSEPIAIVAIPVVPSWHLVDAFPVAPAGSAGVETPPKRSARGRNKDRTASRRLPARRASANGSANSRAPRSRRPVDNARPIRQRPIRQRVFGVGVMVLVGGLFAVLAIPAYADNNAATLAHAAAVQTQKVEVASAAASTMSKTTTRDGYTATSAADLKSIYAQAMREQNIAAYLQSGAKAKGDDYPWFGELSRNQGGGLSPLGYYYRECVDFVAWRLNRDAGTTSAPFRWTWSKLTPNGGDGHQWKAAWLAHGWPTGTTPVPGAVAWFGNNHVGYVNGILDDGQVLIEEYNYTPHAYSTRVINADQAYYLYAPPN